MGRFSAVWALFVLSLPALGLEFGPAARIPSDPWGPPPVNHYQLTNLHAVASRDGYLVAWSDSAGVHYLRLDRQRQPLGPPQSLGPNPYGLSGIVTDGTSFAIASTGYRFATVDAKGAPRITAGDSDFRIRAIAPFGNRFIALAGEVYRETVIILDINGNVLERAPLKSSYRTEQLYEFAGRMWLVRDTDRIPLTDAAGRLAPGAPEPLPIPANEWTLAARVVGSRLYLVTGAPGAKTIVRELDPASAAVARTVALPAGRHSDFALVGDARGRLLVAYFVDRAIRLHAIGEDGSVAAIDVASTEVPQLAMVSDPGGASLFWIDHGVRAAQVRVRTPLTRGGEVTLDAGEPAMVSRVAVQQASLDGAAIGTNVVAVWEQPGPNGTEIHASAIDAGGSPQFLMNATGPRIASNGDVGMVVAGDLRGPRAVRVDREGRALDPAPLVLPSEYGYFQKAVVLWDGSAFVVAYNAYYGVALVRIGAGGELLDSRVLQTASYPSEIALLPTGDGYFLAWGGLRVRNVSQFGEAIFARAVSKTFEPVTEESLVAVCLPGETGVLHPLLAWTENQFHIVWVKSQNVRLIRLLADYEQVDSAFGIMLTQTAAAPERVVSVAGRPFMQLDGFLLEISARSRPSSLALPAGAGKVAAIITAADGRHWMLYTAVEDSGGYKVERAWTRQLQ